MSAMTTADSATFDQWLAYYTGRFKRLSDDDLKGYWWLYGRDSDENAPLRNMATWSAINAEMQRRGL
jgi:hypothetical protein